ncbi:MAG: hypothetical protein H9535_14605 [Ignavibacteria bacterium]|nr:hypothetical protein [Ignavibacteria bacterium]
MLIEDASSNGILNALTKRTSKPAKVPQKEVNLVNSTDPTEIANGMARHVNGWENMSEDVKQEIIALNILARRMHNSPTMRINGDKIDMNDKNPQLHTMRLMRAFCSTSPDFINYMIGKLASLLRGTGGLTAEALNGALAYIDSVNPKSETEAMLALQMFAVNDAAIRALRTSSASEWADTVYQFGNLSVKMMRTFATQAEALAKLQRGGVQTVKHIHVDNRGGQAVIANHVHEGGQNARIENQPYEPSASLLSQDAAGDVMPMSSYTGQEALPDTRRA